MKISTKVVVRELLNKFETDYKLMINILDEDIEITDNSTMLDISSPRKNINASFTISENSKIEDIEKMFFNTFGIKTNITDLEGGDVDKKSSISKVTKLNKKENVDESTKKEKYKKIYTVSERIDVINNNYIKYQQKENYKTMKELLSSIEEALVLEPTSPEINEQRQFHLLLLQLAVCCS